MRKIGFIIISIILTFIMISCDYLSVDTSFVSNSTIISSETTTETTSFETTTTTTTDSEIGETTTTYVDDTIIEMQSIMPGTFFFDASFSNIEVDLLFGRISFTLTIQDSKYENYTYFIVMKDLDGTKKTTKYFGLGGPIVEDTFMFTFTENHRYRISIGKGSMSTYGSVDEVAAFEFQSPSFNDRKHIDRPYFVFDNFEYFIVGSPERNYTEVCVTIYDPDYAITALTLVVFIGGTDYIVFEKELELPSSRIDNEKLIVNDIVSDLTPGVTYDYYVYASGNDGYTDFTNMPLGMGFHKSPKYLYMDQSFDGLYAYPTDINYGDDGLSFYLHYINEGHVTFEGNQIDFYLRIYDSEGAIISSELIDIGDQLYTIPYSQIDIGYRIFIENSNSSLILTRYNVVNSGPYVTITRAISDTEHTLNFTLNSYGNEVTDITITVTYNSELLATITLDQLTDGETVPFVFAIDPNVNAGIFINVSITYIYFKSYDGFFEYFQSFWNPV